ncbi:MAG: hypothetical protein APF77_04290 [Clostridia bacterium BRH_c25]|nr:MAG: hypothetical protein APF77_04290 [Clostridia bacterium BRH_c25]
MQIQTVRGPFDPDQLGRTLMHEHFIFGYPGYNGDHTMAPFDEGIYLRKSNEIIEAVKKQGFKTIIDVTPNDCGRNPSFLKKVAEANDFHIICSTGYYYEGEGASVYFKCLGIIKMRL